MFNKFLKITLTSAVLLSTTVAPIKLYAAAIPEIVKGSATAEAKGLEIAKEVEAKAKNFGDSVVSLDMIIKDSTGSERVRSLTTKTLEGKGGEANKSLTVFEKPNDSKGIALLTYDYAKKEDEQWLYLPEVKREKRISSQNKTGSFVGSQFSFEDLSAPNVDDYTYKYVKSETCGTYNCVVVERFPKATNSGYKKHVIWITDDGLRVMKVEYYDRKDSLLKTLTLSNYKDYDGVMRADLSEMTNHQNGKSTVLKVKTCTFKNGLKDSDFNKSVFKTIN